MMEYQTQQMILCCIQSYMFLGIVNPLMATWPFVINVKGGEKL